MRQDADDASWQCKQLPTKLDEARKKPAYAGSIAAGCRIVKAAWGG
jgi:hypothetical protein